MIGYKIFHGRSSSAASSSGTTTDAAGNVYDANGNLISAAPTAPGTTPDTGLSGGGGGGGVTFIPESGGNSGGTPGGTADHSALDQSYADALTSIATGAFATVGDISTGALGSLGDIGVEQAAALGETATTLANSQAGALGTLTSKAVIPRTTVVAKPKGKADALEPKSGQKPHPPSPAHPAPPPSHVAAPHKLSGSRTSAVVTEPKLAPHPTQPKPVAKPVKKKTTGGGGGGRSLVE